MKPVTQDEAEDTKLRLLAQIQTLATTVPDLLNPEHQRHGPARTDPVGGPGVQRQRLLHELALAGAALTRAALEDDPAIERLAAEVATCIRRLGARKRLGNGCLDTRTVMRPQLQPDTNLTTGEVSYHIVRVPHGPYVYYRWREGGKRRSLYLGRADTQEGWREKLAEIGVDLDVLLASGDDADSPAVPAIDHDHQATPATSAGTSPPVAAAVPDSAPAEVFIAAAPLPRIPFSYGMVKQHKKELTAFVATLRAKQTIGTRDGAQLLRLMQHMLTVYAAESRRRALLEELDRPHADDDVLATAMAEVRRLAAHDPRADAWQRVIDAATAALANGPIRRDADRYALLTAADEIATAAALAAITGDDLLPYLEAQDIDPTPWLVDS